MKIKRCEYERLLVRSEQLDDIERIMHPSGFRYEHYLVRKYTQCHDTTPTTTPAKSATEPDSATAEAPTDLPTPLSPAVETTTASGITENASKPNASAEYLGQYCSWHGIRHDQWSERCHP